MPFRRAQTQRSPGDLALHTGMRQEEILSLTWKQIDFDKERIILHRTSETRLSTKVSFFWKIFIESRTINE